MKNNENKEKDSSSQNSFTHADDKLQQVSSKNQSQQNSEEEEAELEQQRKEALTERD